MSGLVEVLAAHEDCTPNSAALDVGSAVTHVDHWSCGLNVPFLADLDDAERAHVAAAIEAHLAEVLASDVTRREMTEALLTEHMDGDYLVGAGRTIGNEGGDVGLNVARPSEVAWWATAAALAAVREALGIGVAE